MTSVITGDIIQSQKIAEPNIWLSVLKQALATVEPDNDYWEIYRGDSFQIEIRDPKKSFEAAVYIKACLKTIKGLDVRMAIGIGDKTHHSRKVSESNGEAFVLSGETFESLKKEKQNLLIKTKNKKLDEELNLYFRLAHTSMDTWSVNSAEIIKLHFEHPNMLQKDIAKQVGTTQNAISKRQKRANLDEIVELNNMYQQKIKQVL
jgi:predicted XRE-type DNA-binding protein